MLVSTMIPKNRRPTTPGETLREEFMQPLNLTQQAVADALGVDRAAVNEIVNGKRSVSVNMAMRLGHAFGTSSIFWLNLQLAVDIYDGLRAPAAKKIEHRPVLV